MLLTGQRRDDFGEIITEVASASAQHLEHHITLDPVTGVLTVTASGSATASYTVSCSIRPSPCFQGVKNASSSSGLTLDFDVTGTPQTYVLNGSLATSDAFGGGVVIGLVEHTTNTIIVFATTTVSRTGILPPGQYSFQFHLGTGADGSVSGNVSFTLSP